MKADRPVPMLWRVSCWALGSLLFASSAAAQATSGINGKVTDSTAGALPGATVTITSPAMQVPSLTAVTDADGTYRFLELPAGTYEARYELAGFRTAIRTGIRLTVGFIATINMALELGGIQESITVSGASPVVDVTNTRVASTLSVEQMSLIPNGRRPADIAMMTPGMMLNTIPNSSSLGQGSFGNNVTSGGLSNYQIATDGVQHNTGGIRSPDLANVEEIQVVQSGGTADVAQAGTYVNVVSKSGGNEFHGRYASLFAHHSLESNNLDDALRRQGLTTLNTTRYFYDLNADLGGRIIRDRLWFYGSIRDRRNRVGLPGMVLNEGPDGRYLTGDEPPYFPPATNTIGTGKLSYQATNKYQYSGYLQREVDEDHGVFSALGATRFVPYEASGHLDYNPTVFKGEVKGTPTNRFLFTGMVGRDYANVAYSAQPGREKVPAARDLATNLRTGRWYPQDLRIRSKWQSRADVTYLPSSFLGLGGNHELRIGWWSWFGNVDTTHLDSPGGNYILDFDTIGGRPHQPSQIVTYNSPVTPHTYSSGQAAYFTDRWAIGSRLTLNLGFRWDRYHAWVPEQTKVQGTFGTAGTFPRVEAGTWNRPAPRAGFAYNLTGDAKTVVKGTYGWFNDELNETFAAAYNNNTDVITTYRWRDLNGNSNYDPGEVNLDLNGPDFLSITGAANNLLNPDLKHPYTHELTGSFERELADGMGLRALYVWRRVADGVATINALRPYGAFNIPLSRRDPGPDGLVNTPDDGPMVTVYDFERAYRGAAFVGNQRVNVPDSRDNRFQSLELTLTKRSSDRWSAMASGSVLKNHRWITAVSQSPNEDYFPLDETWQWSYRTTASYLLPLDVRLSSLVFLQSGTLGQRTYIFRAADPLGGPPLVQQNTVTLRLDPYGTQQGPMRTQVNLRAGKVIRLGGSRTLELNADFNNIINSNAAWTSDYRSGPTFGYAQTILPPRLVQFGAAFEF